MFLCGGFEAFENCLEDEFVRFANNHLGYICSPQNIQVTSFKVLPNPVLKVHDKFLNIQAFMEHYECISGVLEDKPDCMAFVAGLSLPGQDSRRCDGVPELHTCVVEVIDAKCNLGAQQEFELTIEQFGCDLNTR